MMIVIGASLGGAQAVQQLLAELPASFSEPIAIALHRHRDSGVQLTEAIARGVALPTAEVVDKLPIERGHVYLAPADYHLLIDEGHFALSVDEPVRYARPSIDVLFQSAADAGLRTLIGVVLTGGGNDGARGAAAIEACGGHILIQSPEEAQCGDMPAAVIAATQHAEILELHAIAERLVELTNE